EVIDQLVFSLPQGCLVGQLEEIADDLAAFPVQAPKGQSYLRESLQNFVDFLGQNKPGQMDKDTGPKTGSCIRGTGRKIAKFRMKGERNEPTQFRIYRFHSGIRVLQVEPRPHAVQPQMVLF